jgi:hypothetical protein
VVQQFAGPRADHSTDRGRGQQRRREQPHHEPDGAQARSAFADHVVALLH